MSIVDIAREKALEQGIGLNQEELLQVLQIPDEQLEEIADIAHKTRLKWCGPDAVSYTHLTLPTNREV